MEQKVALDKEQKDQQKVVADAETAMRIKAGGIGNLIYKDVPISNDEVSIPHRNLERMVNPGY